MSIKKSILVGILLVAVSFCGLDAFADSTSTFSVDVDQVVLELTIPQNPAVINLSPTASGAAFGTTAIPIKVATNSTAGYVLTMSVPTTDLVHSTLSNIVIPTLSSTSSEANFPANAWGYKVIGEDYLPVLTSNAPATWTLDGPTNGTEYTLTLAAKVDGTQTSGAYENALSFNVVTIPNALRDTIIYNGNGADSGSMTNQLVYQGEPNKLSANAYSKNGYVFNGWNTTSGGLGTGYGDGEEYTPTISNSAKTITLYAQWLCDSSVNTCEGVPSIDGSSGAAGRTLQAAYEQAYVNNPGQFPKDEGGYKHGLYVPHKNAQGEYDGTYFEATQQSDYDGIPANDLRFAIQDIDLLVDGEKVCDRTTVIGSDAYVLDLRDYRSYHIIKGVDGRCWMQDNLALVPTNPTVAARMNSNNTNATDAVIQHLLNGGSTSNPGWSTSAVSDRSAWSYTEPVIYSAKKDIASADAWDQQYGWKRGVNYTYCAASAGTFCWRDQDPDYTDPHPDSKVKVDNDLCPKGWRMPTGGPGGEYENVFSYYHGEGGSSRDFRKAFRIAMSLPIDYADGSGVLIFSSTPLSSGGIYSLQMYSDFSINISYHLVAWIQASVRCIAK